MKNLEKDAAQGVTKVALFFVQDMSHPYHRAKVDLNAQQLMITGGVLECESPSMACVIVEGGPKAIQKYKRLMLVRMKWTGTDEDDEDDDNSRVKAKTPPRRTNSTRTIGASWFGRA